MGAGPAERGSSSPGRRRRLRRWMTGADVEKAAAAAAAEVEDGALPGESGHEVRSMRTRGTSKRCTYGPTPLYVLRSLVSIRCGTKQATATKLHVLVPFEI